jgi:Secretion system C-terminal sorting domain/Metallo-peptidase family M12
LLLSASQGFTQDLLFNSINVSEVNFSTTDGQRCNTLRQDPQFEAARLIQLPDIRLQQHKGVVTFHFPDQLHAPVRIEVQRIDESPEGYFGWSGKITKGGSGIAVFAMDGNRRAAMMVVDGQYYEIVPVNDQYQVLRRRNKTADLQSPVCPDLPMNTTLSPLDCDYSPDYNTCPAVIDVLLLYTPEAFAEKDATWGGIGFYHILMRLFNNLHLYVSDIPNKEIQIQYEIITGFPFSTATPASTAVRADLIAFGGIASPIRNTKNCDIAVMMTKTLSAWGGLYNGVAFNGEDGDDTYAYGIVNIDAPWFVFPHEFGHILGCRHNWGADNTTVCAHGHSHLELYPCPPGIDCGPDYAGTGKSWGTIMSLQPYGESLDESFQIEVDGEFYLIQNEGYIPHFSNPSVSYGGTGIPQPTGVAGLEAADNAQQIRNYGCTVANFRPGTQLQIFPKISFTTCDQIAVDVDIVSPPNATTGTGPYRVRWQASSDGIFNYNSTILSNEKNFVIDPLPDCPIFFLKCTVTSFDFVITSRIIRVEQPNGCLCSREDFISISNPIHHFKIYPNPGSSESGQFWISTDAAKPDFDYTILDINGRVLLQQRHIHEVQHTITMDNLVQGSYFIKIFDRSTQHIDNQHFIIIK